MPKLKAQIEQERREQALMMAIERCRCEKGLRWDYQMANMIGTCNSNFCQMKKGRFQSVKLRDFGNIARRLGMTDKEVCAALGVKYNGNT